MVAVLQTLNLAKCSIFYSNIHFILLMFVNPFFLPHQRAGQGELKLAEVTPELASERDNSGMTPLMWASAYGQTPTVTRLLQVGMNMMNRYLKKYK